MFVVWLGCRFKDTYRPELVAALNFMRAGDTLVVPSLDRLSCFPQGNELEKEHTGNGTRLRALVPPPLAADLAPYAVATVN